MQYINASGLGKKFGNLTCFENVDLQVHSGRRIGLIGRNGCGKTTLFKILTGEEDEFSGNITVKSDLRVARTDQDPVFSENTSVMQAVMGAVAGVLELQSKIDDVHHQLAEADEHDRLLAKLERLEKEFEACSGHDVERRAEALLEGFGFTHDRREGDVAPLSGGEKNRVALARMLVADSELLLLDEPTNHLDLEGIAYLERYLLSGDKTAVIISHDRRFLDRVVDEIWEIEGGRLYSYPGNFSTSRTLREERMLSSWREYHKQLDFIKKEQEYIRRYGAGQRAREAKGRAKRLSRVERMDKPEEKSRVMALSFARCSRLGNHVLEVDKLGKSYDDNKLFDKLSFELVPGETLGIVGPNGCGKSTLFRIIMGDVEADSGAFAWGQTVRQGYLDQHETEISPEYTPLSFLRTNSDLRDEQGLHDILAAMLFREVDFDKSVSLLSGGERKRLAFTRLLLEGHNFLLLDEPTNHLDIAGCESLELAMSAYEGNILVISHDRYFLDQICDRVLCMGAEGWRLTVGGYAEAAEAAEIARSERSERNTDKPKKAAGIVKEKLKTQKSPLARMKLASLEAKIISCEERKDEISNLFAQEKVYTDAGLMQKLTAEMSDIDTELQALEEEYASR